MPNSRVVRVRRAQGFEWDPPSCCTCAEYELHANRTGKHPWCSVGRFYVQPRSICDRWVDKRNGDTISQAPDAAQQPTR